MCKMLMSIENENELELLQKELAHVCEAMLAFPWRFPGTRFYNGLKVVSAAIFCNQFFFLNSLCFPHPSTLHFQARRRIIKILEKAIRERRGSEAPCGDFLQRLLTEEEEDGDGRGVLSDAEIGDNILTMLIAGQDTTASAITWMVKFLDENPDVLQNLKVDSYIYSIWRSNF